MANKIKLEKLIKQFRFSMSVDFEKLPEEERVRIFKNAKLIELKRKKILYKQHEKVEGVYLLKSGILKVFRTDLNGNSQILFFYRPGEFFGYQPIFGNLLHPIGVAAIEDCEILVIDKNIFIEITQSSTTLCNELLKGYSSEYTVFVNRMNICSQIGKRERLALLLLVLNDKFRTINNQEIDFPAEIKLTRTDLASFVGTSLENLIRMLNYFKEKKLIRVKGKSIFIENFDGLLAMITFE